MTLTGKTYTEAFLKDESAPDGHLQTISVSHLTANAYTKPLLKIESILKETL